MYHVILDERSMTGVDIDADDMTRIEDGGLELFKNSKRVAIFRYYVGVIPKKGS